MTKEDWLDLTVLERKKYNCLSEVMDLSRQMGEAMDRNDQVSVRMLLALRQDPILQLEELQRSIAVRTEGMSLEDRIRVADLGKGAAPQGEEESIYASQAGSVGGVMGGVLVLDRGLNLLFGVCGSFFALGE